MIYGYIRVSTDRQTTENQRFEIIRFCEKNNLKIDVWVEETISSVIGLEKKKLGHLLPQLQKDDIVIASELSRLGRNLFQVMSILYHCMNMQANVWTIKDNYRLGADIHSKVLAFAFGLSAEIERNLISQRTKEALRRIKAEGGILGRPKGSKNRALKLSRKREQVEHLLNCGYTYSAIARKLEVHRATISKFIRREFFYYDELSRE
ncbi:MAG: master DNA invertase Mpi family serine-type recombinase [Deferribacteraceae bacterium]|jgi:DNA invertase Pin-like site-specific DNA recombinase|nr:master DNA invertase Mpi family serine-type recombinase [Deferribacteraceae bacterium]